MLPLVSIVSVNWNTPDVTCAFLQSIQLHNTYPNIEVIIVDNASKEDPTEQFKAVYPACQVVRSATNLGFGGGNNAGIRVAAGEYVFMVNNDTEFTPRLLEGLLAIFEKYPDAGVACPKFHYYFHKGVIEYAGFEPINIFTGRNGMIGSRQVDRGQFDVVKETPFAHGGAMLVRRDVFDAVGGFYEPFFLYYEELDLSEKIRRKGYKLYYQPASLIYHKESMTTGKSSTLKTFYLTRNRILFMRRNMPWYSLAVFSLYLVLFTVPKNTLTFLARGQRDHLRSFWRAIFWQFNPAIRFR
jgi:GT2 family glycosyltransferase